MSKKKKNEGPISVFIRHNQKASLFNPDKGNPENIEKLWEQKLIAICFGNSENTDPDKAEKQEKSALRILNKCGKNGAIVCAEYSENEGEPKVLVGEIEKGQDIEKVEIPGKYTGNPYINRTLKLSKAKPIEYKNHPLGMLLSSLRPRLLTTCEWHVVKNRLRLIFYDVKSERKVSNLAPSQLEVLCYEYLRKEKGLAALLLPIGRELPDVDIYGIDEKGKIIKAQVTQTCGKKDIEGKLNKLKYGEGEGVKLFFFWPKESKNADGVDYISIEEVFKNLDEKGSVHGKMIDKMLPPEYFKA